MKRFYHLLLVSVVLSFLCCISSAIAQILPDDLRETTHGNLALGTELQLQVNSGDVSVLLSGRFSNPDSDIFISSIIAPNGQNIYQAQISNDDLQVSGPLTDDPIGNSGEFAFFLPMHLQAGGQLQTGIYRIQFLAEDDDGTLQNIRALYKTVAGPQQAIDINILVADRDTISRMRSLSDDFSQRLRQEIDSLLTPHGLRVGNLQIVAAIPEISSQFAITDEEQIGDLCNVLDNRFGNERALNVGFVETITSEQISGIAGVSPASPGIIMNGQATFDCVLISERAYEEDVALHATNLLHEMSHFMSMPHSTEENGTNHDRFTDTPECALSIFDGRSNLGIPGNRAGDSAVDDFECGRDGGANNYLFYGGTAEFLPFNISNQQAFILQRHPLFYPAIGPVHSGAWFDPSQSGHGLTIEVLPDYRTVIAWYTFDSNGDAIWLIGSGNATGNQINADVSIVEGGVFPPDFDANAIQRNAWGSLEFIVDPANCNLSILNWETQHPDFSGPGSMPLTRLTNLSGLTCNQ